ncbi:unnamed protein product [Caenorhabditis auriculariae]|uniref:Seipin n=1 Tax=Caenorhabditis auriculariae TaxID=2777116 RepID=A0A8S1HTZ3_9PELO|nr:unnamed protein product [Caenorhabditis auriculariae]
MRDVPKSVAYVGRILLDLSFALCASLIFTIITRYLILPASVYKEFPLNVLFNTCDNELHGVCSFPTATLFFDKGEIFSPSTPYSLNVRLKFADVPTTRQLGLFQNVISIHNEAGDLLKKFAKSAYLKEPSYFMKILWIMFFPLYFLGFFRGADELEVPITFDYIEYASNPSKKLVYTLQDKFANVEHADVIVNAQFGLVRYFLYYWPVCSSLLLFSVFLGIFISIFIGRLILLSGEESEEVEQGEVEPEQVAEPEKKERFAKDEFEPENADEVPEICGNAPERVDEKMSSFAAESQPAPCLGFCGRHHLNTSSTAFSDCGACAWGSRTTSEKVWCEACVSPLTAYDWMYLVFMALFPFLLHLYFIRSYRKYSRSRLYEVVEHACCVLENTIACLVSLLSFPPYFSFSLFGCEKSNFREWFPHNYNPVIDYTKTLRCSYEVVYPLYSMPFLHLTVLVVSIVIFRSIVYCTLMYKALNGKPYYYSMLSIPIIAGAHAYLAGFVYYSFPYILLLWGICANVVHLAMDGKRTMREMILRIVKSPMHIFFLSLNSLLLAFAVVAIMLPFGLQYGFLAIFVVPTPLLFYLVTIPFTHPSSVNESE